MKTSDENQNLDHLVSKLKTEDAHYATIIKAVQIIYWILLPFLVLMTIWDYMEAKDINELIGGICIVAAFLIIVLFFRKYYREYNMVDYSLPTVQMLKKAIWRYQLFQKRTLWVYFGLLVMDVGLIFDWQEDHSIWVTQTIFLGALALGFVIGFIWWFKKFKPLRDEARQLLREIES